MEILSYLPGVSDIVEEEDWVANTSTGTTPFLAPEQCKKSAKIHGKLSDIWSVGVTLYVLHYGKLPFIGKNILETYNAILTSEPEYNTTQSSPALIDLLSKLLTKDPEQRITLEKCKLHPYITKNNTWPMPAQQFTTEQVTEDEISHAIVKGEELKMIDRFIMYGKLKQRFMKKLSHARANLAAAKMQQG